MFSRKLIHYITALTVAMSSLAPSISQAIAVASDAQGLTMEIFVLLTAANWRLISKRMANQQ